MAISRVGSTNTSSTVDTASLTITKPTGVTTGDVLVAGVTSNADTHTVPSGWTEFDGNTLTPTVSWQARLYYKVAGGSEPANYTWTVGTAGPSAGFVSAWRGCDTANPVDSTVDAIDNAVHTEPDTGPSATAIAALGRTYYVRAIRRTTAGGVGGTLSTVTSGVSRDATIAGLSGTGNTAYAISLFAQDTNYSTTGSKAGLAITYDQTEAQNYEATFNLRAPTEGSAAMTLPSVTSVFDGYHRIDATMSMTTPSITSQFEGLAAPPEGSMAMTLPSVASQFEGNSIGGSAAMTLPSVTSSIAGSVNPIGAITSQLAPVVATFAAETVPFGEHVIRVERDERAFRVTDDDTGLIRILRSQVTIP